MPTDSTCYLCNTAGETLTISGPVPFVDLLEYLLEQAGATYDERDSWLVPDALLKEGTAYWTARHRTLNR